MAKPKYVLKYIDKKYQSCGLKNTSFQPSEMHVSLEGLCGRYKLPDDIQGRLATLKTYVNMSHQVGWQSSEEVYLLGQYQVTAFNIDQQWCRKFPSQKFKLYYSRVIIENAEPAGKQLLIMLGLAHSKWFYLYEPDVSNYFGQNSITKSNGTNYAVYLTLFQSKLQMTSDKNTTAGKLSSLPMKLVKVKTVQLS